MKLPCELIRDMLPLYHDGVCSTVSKTLITGHLKECTDCQKVLNRIETELEMPPLEADEAKPLKSIKKRWTIKTWLTGLLIGIAVIFLWAYLTQLSNIPIRPEEYTITNVVRFSNGMYYLEYQLPYDYRGMGADLRRTEDGAVYLQEYRPILARKTAEDGVVRNYIIDPENHRTDIGTETPMTAFYLGLPDQEDPFLLWSAEEEYPLATPEEETEYLYQHIFR